MHHCGGTATVEASESGLSLKEWEKTFEHLLREVYEGKREAGELHTSHVLETYEKLNGGLYKGMRYTPKEDELPEQRIIKMQQNLYKFSAAKDATMLQDMNSLLYENGKAVSFETFKAKANALNIQYNHNWLKTEYSTATQAGHMAQKWEDMQRNKELFPNLKYVTQGDDRVREEHEALHGVIAPIDDAFWSEHYPPNDWNCRCDVVQTAEEANINTAIKEGSSKYVGKAFKHNVGKGGQVFNEKAEGHSFFSLAKHSKDWIKRFELSKLEAGYNRMMTRKGNEIEISIYADEKDLPKNVLSTRKAVDTLALKYKIMPHLNIDGWRNPEYSINDYIADRYEGNVKQGIKAKKKQIASFIKKYNSFYPNRKISEHYAIHIDVSNLAFDPQLARVINGELLASNNFKLLIIERGDKVIKIEKGDSFEEIATKIMSLKAESD